MTEIQLSKNSIIYKEGDIPINLFFIKEGKVEVNLLLIKMLIVYRLVQIKILRRNIKKQNKCVVT